MIETETDNMIRDIEQRLMYQGLNLTQYLQMMQKTEADMRKEFEEQATQTVKTKLVLEAIIKAEKIEASEDEIKEKAEEMAKNYGRDAEEMLKNDALKVYIGDTLKTEKAVDFIVKNAKIK